MSVSDSQCGTSADDDYLSCPFTHPITLPLLLQVLVKRLGVIDTLGSVSTICRYDGRHAHGMGGNIVLRLLCPTTVTIPIIYLWRRMSSLKLTSPPTPISPSYSSSFIYSDKTGTLTQNRMTVSHLAIPRVGTKKHNNSTKKAPHEGFEDASMINSQDQLTHTYWPLLQVCSKQ